MQGTLLAFKVVYKYESGRCGYQAYKAHHFDAMTMLRTLSALPATCDLLQSSHESPLSFVGISDMSLTYLVAPKSHSQSST